MGPAGAAIEAATGLLEARLGPAPSRATPVRSAASGKAATAPAPPSCGKATATAPGAAAAAAGEGRLVTGRDQSHGQAHEGGQGQICPLAGVAHGWPTAQPAS